MDRLGMLPICKCWCAKLCLAHQHFHIGNIFHDRFLILDGKELYLIGASLKDLGRRCFGFTKMDASEIAGIKARVWSLFA